MEPAPLWASSYTHLFYKVQDPFSACKQSKFQKENTSILRSILMQDLSLLHRSRNSERDFIGWSQLLHPSLMQSPALTPISCTKSKIHSAHADSQIPKKKEKHFYFEISLMQDQSLLHRTETQEEILLGGASSLVGQLLHPSLLQSPRSIQRMQTVQIPPPPPPPKKRHFYFEINLDAGPVFATQMKKLRKRFRWVEAAPLWASSYTHPLYKVQDPFSACRESKFKKKNKQKKS